MAEGQEGGKQLNSCSWEAERQRGKVWGSDISAKALPSMEIYFLQIGPHLLLVHSAMIGLSHQRS
jgi:hypothetical protein